MGINFELHGLPITMIKSLMYDGKYIDIGGIINHCSNLTGEPWCRRDALCFYVFSHCFLDEVSLGVDMPIFDLVDQAKNARNPIRMIPAATFNNLNHISKHEEPFFKGYLILLQVPSTLFFPFLPNF